MIDKTRWGEGPWQTEPDRIEFEHVGLPCLMVRHGTLGHWCGYAAVPPGHPMHGKCYDDAPVDTHGGLTYAHECANDVCHVPKPGEPDNVWWFGFDCAHLDDLSPGYRTFLDHDPFGGGVYKDMAYVRKEVERLAEQLVAIK